MKLLNQNWILDSVEISNRHVIQNLWFILYNAYQKKQMSTKQNKGTGKYKVHE